MRAPGMAPTVTIARASEMIGPGMTEAGMTVAEMIEVGETAIGVAQETSVPEIVSAATALEIVAATAQQPPQKGANDDGPPCLSKRLSRISARPELKSSAAAERSHPRPSEAQGIATTSEVVVPLFQNIVKRTGAGPSHL